MGKPSSCSGLSVVLVNYNGAAFLENILADLDRQTTPVREVLVMDNGSTDESYAIVCKHPGATWHKARINRGYGQAANEGVRLARGELILVGNTDLRLPEDFTALALRTQRQNPQASLISPLIMRFDDNTVDSAGQYPAWNLHVRERGFGKTLEHLSPLTESACFSVCGAATLVSRDALSRLCLEDKSLYDPDYFMFWEDFELGWRAQRRGLIVLFAPSIRARHFRSATLENRTSARRGMARTRPPAIRAHIIINRYTTLIRHLSWLSLLRYLPVLATYDTLWLLWLLLPDFKPLPHFWRGRNKLAPACTRL